MDVSNVRAAVRNSWAKARACLLWTDLDHPAPPVLPLVCAALFAADPNAPVLQLVLCTSALAAVSDSKAEMLATDKQAAERAAARHVNAELSK